ncbi:hypothetical protein V5O48_015226, partial [Marasmius crinis-equi]
DIYAYAGVCYEIFTGNTPFHELTDVAVVLAVVFDKRHPSRPENILELTDPMWEIMVSCWAHEAHLRPTADDVLSRVATMRSLKTGEAVELQSTPDWNSHDLMEISKNAEQPPVDTTTVVRLLQKKQTRMEASPSSTLNTSMIEAKADVLMGEFSRGSNSLSAGEASKAESFSTSDESRQHPSAVDSNSHKNSSSPSPDGVTGEFKERLAQTAPDSLTPSTEMHSTNTVSRMTQVGKDPWIAFTESVQLLADDVEATFRGLQPAIEALVAFITLCEQVPVNRHGTRQLCILCGRLLEAIIRYQPLPPYTLEAAYEDVNTCITEVWRRRRAEAWDQLSWGRSLLQLKRIQKDIEQSRVPIQNCFHRFQLATVADTNQWQSEFAEAAREDHEEVIAYLSEVQHHELIHELSRVQGVRMLHKQEEINNNMKQLMVMMQTFLGKLNNEHEQKRHIGLAENLYEIQKTTNALLPDLHLISGEITDVDEHMIAGTIISDIFRGLYLHSRVVAIKVVRAVVEDDEYTRRRFDQEVQIWHKIYNVDKGKYILPFYGWSLAEDMRPYMVSPWQESGTVLTYIRNNDARVDYRKLILNIARGIHVLHYRMDPPVLHGDIRGENIVIDAEGNPLIADFGLSTVRLSNNLVDDLRGTVFTQRILMAQLYRWYAPEVYTGTVSLSSDVYSFAMTILELLTHNVPFMEFRHPQEVVAVVMYGSSPKRPTNARVMERGLDDELWGLLVECWSRLPGARPGIVEVLERLVRSVDGLENILRMVEDMLSDEQECRRLLEVRGDEAQKCLDTLQLLADGPNISTLLRSSILKMMLHLSKRSRLCLNCLIIKNVKRLGEYPVGGGGFGDVWKGEIGEQMVCLKVVKVYLRPDVTHRIEDYMREAIVWQQLSHPNLLPFVGMYYLDETRQQLCLVSPWMERGDLSRYLKGKPRKDVDHQGLAYDVAAGLAYLHERKIVHGDLKSVNVLVTPDERACIGDFGLSRVADSHGLRLSTSTSGPIRGTIRWLSPELLEPPCRSSTRSDIYAYAGVCYEIFTGKTPFHELIDVAVMVAVLLHKQHPSRPENLFELTDPMWEIMVSCWAHEADLRPTADDVLSHVGTLRSQKTGAVVGLRMPPNWNFTSLAQVWRNVDHPSVDTTPLVRLLQKKKQTQIDVSPSTSILSAFGNRKDGSTELLVNPPPPPSPDITVQPQSADESEPVDFDDKDFWVGHSWQAKLGPHTSSRPSSGCAPALSPKPHLPASALPPMGAINANTPRISYEPSNKEGTFSMPIDLDDMVFEPIEEFDLGASSEFESCGQWEISPHLQPESGDEPMTVDFDNQKFLAGGSRQVVGPHVNSPASASSTSLPEPASQIPASSIQLLDEIGANSDPFTPCGSIHVNDDAVLTPIEDFDLDASSVLKAPNEMDVEPSSESLQLWGVYC